MEFRDVLKMLRRELGIAQIELATALRVNIVTIGRWEQGKSLPNRSTAAVLLDYANGQAVSSECLNRLKQSLNVAFKERLFLKRDELYTVEHSSISQLIEDASFPIYVCDMDMDELLYLNKEAEEMLGGSLNDFVNKKCYACLMHLDKPCDFCHKELLTKDKFTVYEAFRPGENILHRVQAKLIKWNGRDAQVRFITDIGKSVQLATQRDRESTYNEQLRIRQKQVRKSVLSARYNLTKNTVSLVNGKYSDMVDFVRSHTVEEAIAQSLQSPFSDEDSATIECVSSRDAIIHLYYAGKTHIRIKHFSKHMNGYCETTLDLIQNPISFDIEMFAALWDINDTIISTDLADRLFAIDYESIMSIDAETGEVHPYTGHQIDKLIKEQKIAGDNVEGVAVYLRKYCIDDDVDCVIRRTSLSYVKEQLVKKKRHELTYKILQDGNVVVKRVVYAYLDKRHTIILCAIQNLTELFFSEEVQIKNKQFI